MENRAEIFENADMREVAKRLDFRDFCRTYIHPAAEAIVQNWEASEWCYKPQ